MKHAAQIAKAAIPKGHAAVLKTPTDVVAVTAINQYAAVHGIGNRNTPLAFIVVPMYLAIIQHIISDSGALPHRKKCRN